MTHFLKEFRKWVKRLGFKPSNLMLHIKLLIRGGELENEN
jgi:hypothetical protein